MSSTTRVGLRPTGFSLSRNLSLFAIPAVYIVGFIPHTIKVIRLGGYFDNLKPRLTGDAVDKASGGLSLAEKKDFETKMDRLGWMHTNSMETLPLFFTAVLIGNYARLPTRTLSIFSLSYLFSRVAYNFLYYYQSEAKTAWTRSGTYFFGVFSSLWVLFKSAKKVYDL